MQQTQVTPYLVVHHSPLKRLFDLTFSFFALLLGSPLFLLLALAVFFTSKGPLIYAHKRVGRGGKIFKCYKFRTMHLDADERLHHLLAEDIDLQNEWNQFYKLKNDPRVTPIGNFLRKTSLDELPQFLNVLKGDLSVVGPRPVTEEELKIYGASVNKFLAIRPGLTGPWQVSGRSDTTYRERVELDLTYVEEHSFVGDLRLIIRTIPAMVTSRGAY